MDISAQKEQFSYAYLQAIAAQAGLNYSKNAVDDDSIDIRLCGKGFTGGLIRNPTIEVQLKCTSQDVIKGNVIKYPLKLKNYDDLRGEDVAAPRYLMVLVVPDNIDNWTHHIDNALILFNNCYWASLRFKPESKNSTNVTVEISIDQKVTAESLVKLMELASIGEYL
ncbi:MAG: DUF4365 domain-containing protein [Candidatus Thiodiazotropha sp.]